MVNHCYNNAAKKKKKKHLYNTINYYQNYLNVVFYNINLSHHQYQSQYLTYESYFEFKIHNLKELEIKIPYEFRI